MKHNTILAVVFLAALLFVLSVCGNAQMKIKIDSVSFISYRKANITGHTENGKIVYLKYGTDHAKQILRPGVVLSVIPVRGKSKGKYLPSKIKVFS